MINNEMVLCSNCTKLFNIKHCENIYRCGDTYVCSQKCSIERFRELRNIDPGFKSPHTWPLVKSKSTCSLFNHEVVTKNQPVNDKHDHISKMIKTQTKENKSVYFDVIHEDEEVLPLNHDDETNENYRKGIEINTINSAAIQSRCNSLCNKCFMLGVPSFCALCILIAYNQ